MKTLLLLIIPALVPACVSSAAPAPQHRATASPIALGVGPVTALGYHHGDVGGRTVTVTETTIDGELVAPVEPSPAAVRAIVTRHLAGLRGCFPANATTTTKIRLFLATDGTPSAKVPTGELEAVEPCIRDTVRGWPRFPVPRDERGPRARAYELALTIEM